MFFKRLCDQWEGEADDAIADRDRQQVRSFSEQEKAVFRKRGEHRFKIPDGSRWGDVKAASTNIGEVLTKSDARGGRRQRGAARRLHGGLEPTRTGWFWQAADPERGCPRAYPALRRA